MVKAWFDPGSWTLVVEITGEAGRGWTLQEKERKLWPVNGVIGPDGKAIARAMVMPGTTQVRLNLRFAGGGKFDKTFVLADLQPPTPELAEPPEAGAEAGAPPPTDTTVPPPPDMATPPPGGEGEPPKRSPFFDSIALWLIFTVAAAVLPVIVLLVSAWLSSRFLGTDFAIFLLIGAGPAVSLSFYIMIKTGIRGWTPVEENWEYRIQVMGKDIGVSFTKGPHLRFPWFNLSVISAKVFMGVQTLELFLDAKVTRQYSGGGDVEFKDFSAPVVVKVFLQIFDSYRATYNIADVFRGVEDKMDERTRLLLAPYKFDDANTKRTVFKVPDFTKDLDPDLKPIERISSLEREFENWGVRIINVSIVDFVLPQTVQEQREKVLKATKDAEAAEQEKKRRVTLAEGTRDALAVEGEGFKKKINSLKDTGLDAPSAADFLNRQALYEKVDGRSLVIESSGASVAGVGAMFGVGFRQSQGTPETKGGGEKK